MTTSVTSIAQMVEDAITACLMAAKGFNLW